MKQSTRDIKILEARIGMGKSIIAATLTSLFDTSYILTVTKQSWESVQIWFSKFSDC